MQRTTMKMFALLACAAMLSACGAESYTEESPARHARSLNDACEELLEEAENTDDPERQEAIMEAYEVCVRSQDEDRDEGSPEEACLEILEEAIRLPDDAPDEVIESYHDAYVACVEEALIDEGDEDWGEGCVEEHLAMCDEFAQWLEEDEGLEDAEREALEVELVECYEIAPLLCEDDEGWGEEDECYEVHLAECEDLFIILEEEGEELSDEELEELEWAIEECFMLAEEVCEGPIDGDDPIEACLEEHAASCEEILVLIEDEELDDEAAEEAFEAFEACLDEAFEICLGEDGEDWDEEDWDDCPEDEEGEWLAEACEEILEGMDDCEDEDCFEAHEEAFEACLEEEGH